MCEKLFVKQFVTIGTFYPYAGKINKILFILNQHWEFS
jgi:hypothetical protein